MSEVVQAEKSFSIDQIPEPKNLEDVVFSLMVNPNLSSINYFNDFSEQEISPESIGDNDTDAGGRKGQPLRLIQKPGACHGIFYKGGPVKNGSKVLAINQQIFF